ncbi:mechanosensitive ion channel [Formosa agariphila KMM 3901]|uniref:Mechanosensitive ion channel n=1 Tax=Formosa agariphila (strain DSM 15362 / KCTC 12365 / LMG 23005 / KMM 3901 / M-2Alg 35-1) TaxID=1347342 RepID=T2KKB3_FORAG|nr:mechanosensitive ion channel domain-containing protein [Formosa agariphila]CDF79205.1 mechanosensitive ion channel [Formosa agariphila KMM 3901]
MEDITTYFHDYFIALDIAKTSAEYLNMIVLLAILLVILFISDFISRKIILQAFSTFAAKSKTNFDDLLVSHKAPRNVAHIVPLIIALKCVPIVFVDFPAFETIVELLLKLYNVVLVIWIIRSVLRTLESYFKTIPSLKDKPIDSYIQVLMLFLWLVGIAFIFVLLTGIEIKTFFTTLGAASAVLLLIFKDTILGFVASIQVAINDTVRIGDWITMDKFGADGDVIEINLNTLQVQNFDKTITYIPTYALISESFKNWRGMSSSGGRRIKRAIIIKAKSVHYLTDEKIEELKKIQLISDYLGQRQEDITSYNTTNNADKSVLINGRNMTNLGVFRKYIQNYIESHSAINKDMTIMTRQLAPTPQGLPLEIYAFSSDKRWQNYEYIMSDIFDHSLAAVPYFDLEIYELSNYSPELSE